jgi:hypothetical protein
MAQSKIIGIESLTADQLKYEIQNGGKFVVFLYCISVIILTFKQSSDIYFIRSGESAFGKSFGFTLISLMAGWWGFPWGPIYTLEAIITNLGGGKNITPQVLLSLGISMPAQIGQAGSTAPYPAGLPPSAKPASSRGVLATIAAIALFLLSGLFLLLSLIGLLLVIGHLITFLSPPPGAETPTLAQFGCSLFCFASTLFIGALLLVAGVVSLRRKQEN